MPGEIDPKIESERQDLTEVILKSVDELPPMPQVMLKAQELIANPDSNVKQVSALLESDQSIAAKVLKMANSAFYGMSGRISSIQHASLVLGFGTLGEVISLAGAASYLDKQLPGYGFESQDLWRHSLSVGICAKMLTKNKNPDLEPVARTAGLIHDIGKIILDPFVLSYKDEITAFMEQEEASFLTAEKEILGCDHAEIASEICKTWNIPDEVSLAIRYHHVPSASQGSQLAYILHMSDYVAITSGDGYEEDDFLFELENGTMDFLGIGQDDVSDLTVKLMEVSTDI